MHVKTSTVKRATWKRKPNSSIDPLILNISNSFRNYIDFNIFFFISAPTKLRAKFQDTRSTGSIL